MPFVFSWGLRRFLGLAFYALFIQGFSLSCFSSPFFQSVSVCRIEKLGMANQYCSAGTGAQELHVLAVDDSLVDRKVIERLLKISSCKGLIFIFLSFSWIGDLLILGNIYICMFVWVLKWFFFLFCSDSCGKWEKGFAVSGFGWR